MLRGWKRVVVGLVLVAMLIAAGIYLLSIGHATQGGGVLGQISLVVLWLIRGRVPGLPAGGGE